MISIRSGLLSTAAAAFLLGSAMSLHAGDFGTTAPATDPSKDNSTSAQVDTTPAPSNLKTSYEFDADASFVGGARTNFGFGQKGNVAEQNSEGKLVVAPQWNDGPIYRFGLGYERYSFGFSKAAPLPNVLTSETVVVGVDFSLFNNWLVRVEADPGLYGDGRSMGLRDFNVPFLIGGSYIVNDKLQWIIGLEVDVDRSWPVLPGVGVHWTFMDNWVLDAVLPNPRVEYDWSKDLTLYFGGDFKDGTYRVDRDFGTGIGRRKLNGAIVEYDEIRVGAGFSWKPTKAVTVEMEGGVLPYREFNFHRDDTHFGNDAVAPYGALSVNAAF